MAGRSENSHVKNERWKCQELFLSARTGTATRQTVMELKLNLSNRQPKHRPCSWCIAACNKLACSGEGNCIELPVPGGFRTLDSLHSYNSQEAIFSWGTKELLCLPLAYSQVGQAMAVTVPQPP